jgi:hypothetical protein
MKTVFLISVFTFTAVGAFAADEPKKSASPAKSLDDELFKGLDDATTAPGVKSKSESPGAKPGSVKPATPQPGAVKPKAGLTNPLDEELLRALEGDETPKSKPKSQPAGGAGEGGKTKATKPASDDPFLRLTEQIREVEERLRRAESGDETQQQQQKIVDDLEKLITQIEQQQQQQQSKSQSQPGQSQPKPGGQQPNQQSQDGTRESSKPRDSQDGPRSPTAPGKADVGNLKSLLEKAWGTLPERERQAVMQTSVDDFPAKYQYVIEEYFKSLLKREE